MTSTHPNLEPSATNGDDAAAEPRATRRIALRTLLAGGGAAAGALAFGKTVSAADGDQIVIGGAAQTAQSPTIIDYTGAAIENGPSVLSAGGRVPDGDSPFPAGVGGYGDNSVPNGVHGSTTSAGGFGVVAANLAGAPGAGDTTAALAVASVAGSHIRFVALGGETVGPPAGSHLAGDLYRDAEGTLWFTVPDGDADGVRFVEVAGSRSAGSFHIIDPQRAYDSRQAGYVVRGRLEPNQNRVISVADGRNAGGGVIVPDAVPEGATAVLINLTIDDPTGPNFLQVTDGDTTSTQTSVLNWSPGTSQLANSITVPLNADREIRVYCGNQTGATHVLVDVFGYYL